MDEREVMTGARYNWKRFWCPRGGRINLSDGGFLVDPDEVWGSTLNPGVVPLQAMTHIPCLILLGEPGIGKSTALPGERDRSPVSGPESFWVDLREYQTDSRLHQDVLNTYRRRQGFPTEAGHFSPSTCWVEGQPGGTCDRISAITEVKGCWNPDLMNAMETQLAERYLKDNRCPFGLYLVGWFACDQWDGADYRKGQTPKLTLAEAQVFFDAQARSLSTEARHIRAFVLNTALR
jgi:hypothetical protein